MSHGYHEGPEDAILYDGCDECETRSKSIEGLLGLDSPNLRLLIDRMLAVELGRIDRTPTAWYRTGTEKVAGRNLYYVYVLVERLEAYTFFDRLTREEGRS